MVSQLMESEDGYEKALLLLPTLIETHMSPILKANDPDLGSFISIISATKASYYSYLNVFGYCIQSFQGGVLSIESKNSSIKDSHSQYGFSVSVQGGNFYCLNCLVYDVEEPSFAFSFAYQGALTYLQYDDQSSVDLANPISFSFKSYKMTGSVGWYNGGFITINGAFKSFIITVQDSIMNNCMMGREAYNNDGQYGGGFIYLIGGQINITIKNSTLSQFDGGDYSYGMILYLVSSTNIAVTIDNSNFTNVGGQQKGQIIYGSAATNIDVLMKNTVFVAAGQLFPDFVVMSKYFLYNLSSYTTGSGFYLRSSNYYFTNYTSINNSFQSFIGGGSSGQDLAGALFSLVKNQSFTDYGSNFTGGGGTEGGCFFCSSCNISLNGSIISNFLATRGGFIYVNSDTAFLKFYNVQVSYTMTNDAGGFLFFMQDITSQIYGEMYFESVSFRYTGTYFGGGLMALNCPKCNVTFKSCSFQQGGVGGMDAGTGTVTDGGFFFVSGVKFFTIQDSSFTNLSLINLLNIFVSISGLAKDAAEYQRNFGTIILYSEITASSTFIFDNITVNFDPTNDLNDYLTGLMELAQSDMSQIQNTYMYLFKINCQNAIQCTVITRNSHFLNNFIGYSGGIFNLNQVDFYDSGSSYTLNLAITGSTLAAQNSNITVSSNTYSQSNSYSGGVFSLLDSCNVMITSSSFDDCNSKLKGGVLTSEVATDSYNGFASIAIYNSSFTDVTTIGKGGAISLENEQTGLIVDNNQFSDVSIDRDGGSKQFGGVISVTNALYIQISNNQFQKLSTSLLGNLLYAQSSSIKNITLTDNFIQCGDALDSAEVQKQYKSGSLINYQNTIYISQVQKVISKRNQVQYCNYNNEGGVFFLDQTTFYDSDSLFQLNSAKTGGVIYSSNSTLYLTSTIFRYNTAHQGGVIALDKSSVLTADVIQMTSNYASYQAGCILARTDSYFTISDSSFKQNVANQQSSVLQALSTSITNYLTFYGCQISGNSADQNTMTVQYAKLKIITCTFADNTANSQSKNLFLGFSEVIIQGSTFKNAYRKLKFIDGGDNYEYIYQSPFEILKTDKTSGSFIYCILNVNLTISYSSFWNGTASVGGAIFVSGASNIKISKTTFLSNFANTYGGAIYGTGFSLIQVDSESIFQDSYSNYLGDDIFVRNSDQINLVNTTFQSKYATNSLYFETVTGLLNQVIIKDNDKNFTQVADNGGGLLCVDCYGIIIKKSSFLNLKAQIGGCISIQQTDNSRGASYYEISNSVFENCTAKQQTGGSIYLENIENFTIMDTLFKNGTSPDFGGAIYFSCMYKVDSQCILNLTQNNTFAKNYAGASGGAIYWTDVEPLLKFSSLNFTNNTARIYGDNIGCFAQSLTSITQRQLNLARGNLNEDDQSSRLRQLSDATMSESSGSNNNSISSVRSGQMLPNMYLALVDKYGQIIKTDQTSKVTIRIDTSVNQNNVESLKYSPTLTGTSQFISQNGTFLLEDIQFTSTPGFSYKISFLTDGIDLTKPSNKQFLAKIQEQNPTASDITFDLSISLRECAIGEQFTDSGSCNECSSKIEYLLMQQDSPGTCQTCPATEAVCLGGSNIGPQPGYWRSSNYSDNFIQCLRPASGMVAPDINPMGSCANGYRGVLCADCQSGFSRDGDYGCSICPNQTNNILLLTLIILGVALAMVLLIRSTLRGATARKNVISLYTKIIMNHLQLLLIASSFDFNWPEFLTNFFNSFKRVSKVSQQILSIDCLITQDESQTSENSSSQLSATSYLRTIYVKTIIMAVLPFLIWIISTLSWKIILRKGSIREIRIKSVSSLVILMFFIYSNIVQMMLDMFNCIKIDDQRRLKVDLEVICYRGAHFLYSFAVAVPALFVWGLGTPIFSYILLTKHKEKLDTYDIRAQYGFIYRGYKLQYYFYESVVMYRKTILVFVTVFMVSFGVIVQALAVFMLVVFSAVKQLLLKPYQTRQLNFLEILSLFASGITIYIGIFFIIDSSTTGSNSFNFFSNVLFLALWLYYFLIEIREFFIKKMGWLYMSVILCGNKERLFKLQQEIDTKEENEILREEYMNILKKLKKAYDNGQLILNRTILERIQVYLNLDKMYTSVGLNKAQVTDDHTKLRRQRIKQDKQVLEALYTSNSSEGDLQSSERELFEMIKKNLNQKDTLIDINFESTGQKSSYTRSKLVNFTLLDSQDSKDRISRNNSDQNRHIDKKLRKKDWQLLGIQSSDQVTQDIHSGRKKNIFDSLMQNSAMIEKSHTQSQFKSKINQSCDFQTKSKTSKNKFAQPPTIKITTEKQELKNPTQQTQNQKRIAFGIEESKMGMGSIQKQSSLFQKKKPRDQIYNNGDDEDKLIQIGFEHFEDQSSGDQVEIEDFETLEDEMAHIIDFAKNEYQDFQDKDKFYLLKASKRKLNQHEFRKKQQLLKGAMIRKDGRMRKVDDAIVFVNKLLSSQSEDSQTKLRPQLTLLQGDIPNNVIMEALNKKRTFKMAKLLKALSERSEDETHLQDMKAAYQTPTNQQDPDEQLNNLSYMINYESQQFQAKEKEKVKPKSLSDELDLLNENSEIANFEMSNYLYESAADTHNPGTPASSQNLGDKNYQRGVGKIAQDLQEAQYQSELNFKQNLESQQNQNILNNLVIKVSKLSENQEKLIPKTLHNQQKLKKLNPQQRKNSANSKGSNNREVQYKDLVRQKFVGKHGNTSGRKSTANLLSPSQSSARPQNNQVKIYMSGEQDLTDLLLEQDDNSQRESISQIEQQIQGKQNDDIYDSDKEILIHLRIKTNDLQSQTQRKSKELTLKNGALNFEQFL